MTVVWSSGATTRESLGLSSMSVASKSNRLRCVISDGLVVRRPASAAEEDVLWTGGEEEEEEVHEAMVGDDDAVFAGLIIFLGMRQS